MIEFVVIFWAITDLWLKQTRKKYTFGLDCICSGSTRREFTFSWYRFRTPFDASTANRLLVSSSVSNSLALSRCDAIRFVFCGMTGDLFELTLFTWDGSTPPKVCLYLRLADIDFCTWLTKSFDCGAAFDRNPGRGLLFICWTCSSSSSSGCSTSWPFSSSSFSYSSSCTNRSLSTSSPSSSWYRLKFSPSS